MTSYHLCVTLRPSVCTVSCLPPPTPIVPSPEDHRASFRERCLVLYHEARIGGFDHRQSIREASRLLKLAGHPWSAGHVVAMEINQALGRRAGRSRRGAE